ncbi:MAG: hypothetical protein GF375_04940 [Candidatus Omnitrophica bacterium]|nr:hypothetical protein [Candidatus Omnitrophota bacterium]
MTESNVPPGGLLVGAENIECPICGNSDLVIGIKGFFYGLPVKNSSAVDVSNPVNPVPVFICTDNNCKNFFDLEDWLIHKGLARKPKEEHNLKPEEEEEGNDQNNL